MNPSRLVRRSIPAVAAALLAVVLVAPAAKAADIPPLVTSAQYKALVKFVERLEQLSNTPAAAAQKADYENQLENKHQAAVDKSTALFNRGKRAAAREQQRAIRRGVQTIRRTESTELAALRREYDTRLNNAASAYEAAVNRVEDVFDSRSAALNRQISRLRKQKANATSELQKRTLQEAIDRRLTRAAENRKLKAEELEDLKSGYAREKAAIRAAKRSATLSVQQNDNEAITTLRNHAKRIYNRTVHTLQARRANQLNDLERKLNAGRAAIARMPAAS